MNEYVIGGTAHPLEDWDGDMFEDSDYSRENKKPAFPQSETDFADPPANVLTGIAQANPAQHYLILKTQVDDMSLGLDALKVEAIEWMKSEGIKKFSSPDIRGSLNLREKAISPKEMEGMSDQVEALEFARDKLRAEHADEIAKLQQVIEQHSSAIAEANAKIAALLEDDDTQEIELAINAIKIENKGKKKPYLSVTKS